MGLLIMDMRKTGWLAGALMASMLVVGGMGFYVVSGRGPTPSRPAGHPEVGVSPMGASPAARSAGNLEPLAERLKAKLAGAGASDGAGWLLLARSYVEMQRHADAAAAFAKARELLGDGDAQMLADYADAVAVAAGRRFDSTSRALIAAALAADPGNAKALELDASAAFDSAEYGRAAAQWQKVLAGIDPASDHGRILAANIAESQARGRR